ncbi:MAG: hypothetical protein DA408_15510 [Bacteroidetes bacterium]|nr:MAG: hypothetical protein C7N36_19115 [Bacteroidota bacterium]PTM10655.1 MAG: hypothetical protein DA408_15510 [Bacteroidota bacterium]
MEAIADLPLELNQRLAMSEVLHVPAPWDAFLDMLPRCPYRIEYDDHEIISIMGYATEAHEQLVLAIAHLLRELLGVENYQYFGSNLALHIPDPDHHYFNADCTVIQDETEKIYLRGSMYAIANPVLLVEILSPSTYNYDLGQKFTQYRKIPSLKQVLFIDSEALSIISQTRLSGTEDWLLREYNSLQDEVPVLNQGTFSMEALYQKITFPR